MTGGPAPAAGEAWLSASIADQLELDVGDELSLAHPRGTWTVSGVGRLDADFDHSAVVLDRFPLEQFRRDASTQLLTTVDLPGSPSSDEVHTVGSALEERIGADGLQGNVRWPGRHSAYLDPAFQREQLAWGWVAGVIALAAMGIVIAAAFATSAGRQLVTIGLLSANGASATLIRRTLALQGFWTGVVGSVAGIGLGMLGLVAGRSTIEQVAGNVFGPYQFAVIDLVVIGITGTAAATIAALIPARTATGVPVTTALAGRRPLGTVPRGLVPIGIVLFAFGTFLLVVTASSEGGGNAAAAAAVIGGVLALAGACCASPLAIDRMSGASALVGRSWRFAGRSLGRTRHRSPAVVTAIAITAAAAVAGSALALSADASSPAERYLPVGAAVLNQGVAWPGPTGRPPMLDYEASPDRPIGSDLRRQVEAIVPSAQWHPLRTATWDPAPYPEAGPGPRTEAGGFALPPDSVVVVADPAVIDLYELGETDRAALESTGVLLLDPWTFVEADWHEESITLVTEGGEVTLPMAAREWVTEQLERPTEQIEFDGVRGFGTFLITEEAADRAGLDVVTRGAIIRADGPLTKTQKSSLEEVVYAGEPLGAYYRDIPRPDQSSSWSLGYDWTNRRSQPAAVQAVIVLAALLLTLLVVAIGLSLAATESRDERDVLVAIGARPSTMRRIAGVKAMVITLTGVLLAIPTGLIPVAAVRRTLDEPFVVPWLAIAGLVVVVPVVAGLAAWGVSSVAQRARPALMSTLAFE